MDDDFEDAESFGAVPARKIDFLIIGLEFAKDMAGIARDFFDSTEDALGLLSQIACQHANFLLEQKQIHAEMARELETILEGDGGE